LRVPWCQVVYYRSSLKLIGGLAGFQGNRTRETPCKTREMTRVKLIAASVGYYRTF
jgi:hypothetical protein